MGFETTVNEDSHLEVRYDFSKVFLCGNRFDNATFKKEAALDIKKGAILGRITAEDKVVLCDESATDGSQFPVGVLAQDLVDADATPGDVSVSMCIEGDVAKEKISFATGTTLDSVVDGRILKDLIVSSTKGIKLVDGVEMTNPD